MSEHANLYLDVHTLSPIGPNNLNRDAENMPKVVTYGGVARSRLSSQSIKASVRRYLREHAAGTCDSLRSRALPAVIAAKLVADGVCASMPVALREVGGAMTLLPATPKARTSAWNSYVAAVKKAEDDNKPYDPALSASYLMSQGEIAALTAVIASHIKDGDGFQTKPKNPDALMKRMLAAIEDTPSSLDVLLFGKMFADNKALTAAGSVQVAHAIGIGPYAGDTDFFTTVDDIKARDDAATAALRDVLSDAGVLSQSGADLMDTAGLSAGTMYRYTNVNLRTLHADLGSDRELTVDAVRRYLAAFMRTLPTGKQNAFAARVLPSTVLMCLRTDQPISYVGAFEIPVRNAREGAQALVSYADGVLNMYGKPNHTTVLASCDGRDDLLRLFTAANTAIAADSLDAGIDTIIESLSGAL